MSKRALGWDTHRKFSKVSVMEINEQGEFQVVERARLDHEDQEGMRRWLSRLAEGTPVALEAAFGWPWVADLLQELKLDPHLAHPPATRILARHEAKTDRCDADRLGRFYLGGKLPESYLAPPEVRELRDRIRYRMALARIRTGIKNRIGAVLHRRGVLHRYSDLFGRAGRRFLEELNLSPGAQVAVRGYLEVLDQTQRQLDQVECWMQRNLKEDEVTRLLGVKKGTGAYIG